MLLLVGGEAMGARIFARVAERAAERASRYSTKTWRANKNEDEEEFRVLKLIPSPPESTDRDGIKRLPIPPPRSTEMPVDQDWTAVWPGPRTFSPSVVPLPLYQGSRHNENAPPTKYGNAELMKIPNFLHLTPPAVKKHCEALKQFCTEWPASLESEQDMEKHLPVQIISSDYCYSSPTIREPLARIVSMKVKVSSLKLDARARDKLLRLVGDRYNPLTDTITITVDRCPTKKQNLDYVNYLLTALYHESWRTEAWEAEKSVVDMEHYDFEQHQSRKNLVAVHRWPEQPSDYEYETIPHAAEYKEAVSNMMNQGESWYALRKYKEAVKNLLNLKFEEQK